MDKSAVWSASEQELVKLDLTERGYICIKSYSAPSNIEEQNDELLTTAIWNTGKEKANKKSWQYKAVSFG